MDVPAQHTIHSGSRLGDVAKWLVAADVLQEHHLRPKAKSLMEVLTGQELRTDYSLQPEDIRAAMETALGQYGSRFCHYQNFFDLALTDQPGEHDLGYDHDENYRHHRKLAQTVAFGVFYLVLRGEPDVYVIGPKLQQLEAAVPRLGQTVLSLLEWATWASCRCLNPRSGYHWAQMAYWMGEEDEEMQMEEDIAQYDEGDPGRPTPETWQGFRKKHYDDAIPGWAGSGTIKPLGRARLAQLTVPAWAQPVLAVAQEISAQRAKFPADYHTWSDNSLFDGISSEATPFILRWSDTDPLPQIWDDHMECEHNSGDKLMDVNAVWAWHDEAQFHRALHRIQHYLTLCRLSIKLINLLKQ